MKMNHYFKKILFLSCALCLWVQSALAAMPGTPAALNKPDAWVKPNGNAVLAAPARIKAMNQAMEKATFGDTLGTISNTVSGPTLASYVDEYEMDWDQFVQGAPLSDAFGSQLVSDARKNIKATNTVRYGVVVDRSDLRSFPTLQRAFDDPSDYNFDNWQETAVDPATPVRVYHTNPQGTFVFVRTRDYRGWLPLNKVAITDAATWQTYANPAAPAVVTARLLTLKAGAKNQLYQMGTAIPTKNGNLLLPTRDHKGHLVSVPVKAAYGASLHQGYLPYTTNNTIRLAFRHLGAPYGWGGMKNSVDCSAFVQDVYKAMGIYLPRNGDEQAKAFPGKSFRGLSHSARIQAVKSLAPGSVIYTPGHVMLILGNNQGTPYMIHSIASYGQPTANGVVKNRIMQVVVSKADLLGGSGTSLLDQVTKGITYR